MKKIRSKIKYFALILSSFALSFPVCAQTMKERLKNLGTSEGGLGYKEISEGDEEYYFADTVGSIINVVLGFLAVIFVVLIIYGGFVWMTARGSEEKVGDARKIIVNSSLGLAVVMLAYLITWFVVYQLGKATGFETGL
ncbi:hypothetical protein KAS41_03640 [Candidatus Parcubacteria bacterium]|nr:hypothetical protein [Candidatus Parcubacteria bacterium]